MFIYLSGIATEITGLSVADKLGKIGNSELGFS
jgi:hypothetical protein